MRPPKWNGRTPARASCASRWESPPSSSRCYWGCGVYNLRGEHSAGRELGEQLLSWPSASKTLTSCSRPTSAVGHLVLWRRAHRRPAPSGAGAAARRPAAAPCMPRAILGTTLGSVATCSRSSLWLLGYPDQAVASSQAALALAQQLAHPFSLAVPWPGRPCSITAGAKRRSPKSGRRPP